jgi:hypothetical protein
MIRDECAGAAEQPLKQTVGATVFFTPKGAYTSSQQPPAA